MAYFLTKGLNWSNGYFTVFILQIILTAILLASLPLWKRKSTEKSEETSQSEKPLGLQKTTAIPGAKAIMLIFLCYCAIEQTIGLWAVSYIVFEKGVLAETAAGWGTIFFLGITLGRFLSGILTAIFDDKQMVRIGIAVIAAGILTMFLPVGNVSSALGLFLIGFGCAPVYPCLIHSTPQKFGIENSQAIIGVEMASAYVGSTFMPPFFGVISNIFGIRILPLFAGLLLVIMFFLHEKLCRTIEK